MKENEVDKLRNKSKIHEITQTAKIRRDHKRLKRKQKNNWDGTQNTAISHTGRSIFAQVNLSIKSSKTKLARVRLHQREECMNLVAMNYFSSK